LYLNAKEALKPSAPTANLSQTKMLFSQKRCCKKSKVAFKITKELRIKIIK